MGRFALNPSLLIHVPFSDIFLAIQIHNLFSSRLLSAKNPPLLAMLRVAYNTT